MIKLTIGGIFLIVSLSMLGCSQTTSATMQELNPTPVAQRISSFFGLSLGQIEEDATALLGQVIDWKVIGGKVIRFLYQNSRSVYILNDGTASIVALGSESILDNVRGVRAVTKRADAITKLGANYQQIDGTSYYFLIWESLGTYAYFSYAHDEVIEVGIYTEGKMVFNPD